MDEIKRSVQSASVVIRQLGKNFDVTTMQDKLIALNKAIRENESAIFQSSKQIQQWNMDALVAFNNNDLSTFNAINKDIEDQIDKIKDLVDKTKEYQDALSTLQGLLITTGI